jgi:predicted DCC family thiol-disulfide oxidoreductase YuxK
MSQRGTQATSDTASRHPCHEVGTIIVFDGVCCLCNRWVRFVTNWDNKKVIRFASLQSDAGQRILERYGIADTDSIVLVKNGHAYARSSAVLRILRELSWPLPIMFALMLIPRAIVARNRYRWFGKQGSCTIDVPVTADRTI